MNFVILLIHIILIISISNFIGSVAEWFKALVLKTSEVQASVSSNLTASANPLKMTSKMWFGPLVVQLEKMMAILSSER